MEVTDETRFASSIAEAVGAASRLLKGCNSARSAVAVVDRAMQLLDACPNEVDEHFLIRRRLVKAQRFLRCGEIGAAEFELNMLMRSCNMQPE